MRLNKVVLTCVERAWCVLAGGAVRALFTGERPLDYDLFFFDEEGLWLTARHLMKRGFKLTFACPSGKLYTFVHSEHDGDRWQNTKVQLIAERYYPSVESIIDDFDIIPGCAALIPEGIVIAHPQFLVSLWEGCIWFNKITYPVSTLKRVAKYAVKGYFLPSDAAAHYVETVRTMPMTDESMRAYID